MISGKQSFTATEAECVWTSSHADILSSWNPAKVPSPPRPDSAAEGFAALALPDRLVEENKHVRCPITRPAGIPSGVALNRVCILLHGLNERSWDKYGSWAQAIADNARCAVISFPVTFHMDRTPAAWANFGIMRAVSKDRVSRYPGIRQSSMANAAISERLDEAPDRLFLSGLMAARDLGDLARAVSEGRVPGIAPGATTGFFGYSIGAYLLQCLILAGDPAVAGRRSFLFCGGPFLSAMTPVSKFIMDSRAHRRIFDFWVNDLGSELERNDELAGLVYTPIGRAFCAMVDPRYPHENRRSAFSGGGMRVAGLAADEVMPRAAILDFFEGTDVKPLFLDLPPACTHIAPFSPLGGDAVRAAFDLLFGEAASHLFA